METTESKKYNKIQAVLLELFIKIFLFHKKLACWRMVLYVTWASFIIF